MGSECFFDENLFELCNFKKQFVLALDYDLNGEMLGTKNLFTQPEFWSENVIVMTLNHVGSLQGVAIDLLLQLKRHHSQKKFIAAGGVRNVSDLEQLKTIGINHVLVASALHSGAITVADIITAS